MAARARQAICTRMNSCSQCESLRGFYPCAADWHAKINFMTVSCFFHYGYAWL